MKEGLRVGRTQPRFGGAALSTSGCDCALGHLGPGSRATRRADPKARVIGSPNPCWRTYVRTLRPAGPRQSRRPGLMPKPRVSASLSSPRWSPSDKPGSQIPLGIRSHASLSSWRKQASATQSVYARLFDLATHGRALLTTRQGVRNPMPLLGIMTLQRWPRCLWTTSELSLASAGLLFQLAAAIALDTVVTTKPRNGYAAKDTWAGAPSQASDTSSGRLTPMFQVMFSG